MSIANGTDSAALRFLAARTGFGPPPIGREAPSGLVPHGGTGGVTGRCIACLSLGYCAVRQNSTRNASPTESARLYFS